MGRGKIELLDTLLDQKLIGRLLWEHGNKLFRGVKQFFWFGRLINNNGVSCRKLHSAL